MLLVLVATGPASADRTDQTANRTEQAASEVLDWNQVLIDTLIATNAASSSSPRLGATVHAAIFDAFNGIERRYTRIVMQTWGPRGASSRAAVVAAAHTALVGLFPSRVVELDACYADSLAALNASCESRALARKRHACARKIERGLAWGTEVARAVLAWRADDGSAGTYEPFQGGSAVGQWRPTPPSSGAMAAQALAFARPFVIASRTQFRPGAPRRLTSGTYAEDFKAVMALGRKTGSTRTAEQTALAPFWEGNASIHWNQAANQIARTRGLSASDSNRLLALLNIAMADTVFTIWSAKRFYGGEEGAVTWRPVTSIRLAESDGNAATASDPAWEPLMSTPSHPEYPAGHPSLNGAGATVLLRYFDRRQTFTLTTAGQPARTYHSIASARADGNNARVWGGMHYPSSVAASDATGEAIARHVDRRAMQPVRGWRADRAAARARASTRPRRSAEARRRGSRSPAAGRP
jgi:membrane-associated phospholipid phosphatase